MHPCLRCSIACLALLLSGLTASAITASKPDKPVGRGLKNLFNYGDLDVKPTPVERAAPEYPAELRSAGVHGDVVVEFIINTKGEVIATAIVTSADERLEGPAMEAVKKWKFTPPQKYGKAVNCRASQQLTFGLPSPGTPMEGYSPEYRQYYSKDNRLFVPEAVGQAPEPVAQPPAVLTPELIALERRAAVTVEFVVSKTGDVEFPKISTSTDHRFDEVCLAAVKAWKFKPAIKDGQAVNCRLTHRFRFD